MNMNDAFMLVNCLSIIAQIDFAKCLKCGYVTILPRQCGRLSHCFRYGPTMELQLRLAASMPCVARPVPRRTLNLAHLHSLPRYGPWLQPRAYCEYGH
jgi:hypothetical protein